MKLGMGEEIKDINQKVFEGGKRETEGTYSRGGSRKVNFANLASDNLLKNN